MSNHVQEENRAVFFFLLLRHHIEGFVTTYSPTCSNLEYRIGRVPISPIQSLHGMEMTKYLLGNRCPVISY